MRAGRAVLRPGTRLASWVDGMGRPRPESARSRRMAHLGGVSAVTALVIYVTWRIAFTLPDGGWDRTAAWVLVTFEALPLLGLVVRLMTLWNIDGTSPEPITEKSPKLTVAVWLPTYNEPVEVIAPAIAAACALQPAHQTWVLDDGDREWVAQLCAAYGARYVRRDVHDHAKAGNMNHALDLMNRETALGAEDIDIIAVLDCDHVPLPAFLTATLGWFEDPNIALVQAPQSYYNSGAFDDDGDTGEQGVFFHVLLPARNNKGVGPFWCGSTSLIRSRALRDVGGVSTDTIVEDMHTTLALIRRGWKTAYHHQNLAVGLAPSTPEQYLLQRRRWGMGSMQVLVTERLWAAKRWLSWRNFYEYLSGTLWWLEGVGTVLAFTIPAAVLVSGAQTSTADPVTFIAVFGGMFWIRLWGAQRMFRGHLHWPTAFALRILRVPIGLSCLWWLITRRELKFQVTPKAGAAARVRGRVPNILFALVGLMAAVVLYALLGFTDWVPWHVTHAAAAASGLWIVLAGIVLVLAIRRIQSPDFATSRRNAHRVPLSVAVNVNGVAGEITDLSVGGAAARFPAGALARDGSVELVLPGQAPITMRTVRMGSDGRGGDAVSLRVAAGDWAGYRALSLWLFHTPDGVIDGIPPGTPAVAATDPLLRRKVSVLARQHG